VEVSKGHNVARRGVRVVLIAEEPPLRLHCVGDHGAEQPPPDEIVHIPLGEGRTQPRVHLDGRRAFSDGGGGGRGGSSFCFVLWHVRRREGKGGKCGSVRWKEQIFGLNKEEGRATQN
jgi:hypothetical protein